MEHYSNQMWDSMAENKSRGPYQETQKINTILQHLGQSWGRGGIFGPRFKRRFDILFLGRFPLPPGSNLGQNFGPSGVWIPLAYSLKIIMYKPKNNYYQSFFYVIIISLFSIKHKFWASKINISMRCFFYAPKTCYYRQLLK